MPGYVMHLAMAEMIIKELNITDRSFVDSFRVGCIIPDTIQRTKKQKSHYWSEEMVKHFARVPDVTAFAGEYGQRISEPYIFGYYCHLYLDKIYMDRYWTKHFTFLDTAGNPAVYYDDVDKVLLDNHELYNRTDFFSNQYYYGDYDKINAYFVNRYKLTYEDNKKSLDNFFAGLGNNNNCISGCKAGDIKPEEQKDALYGMIEHLKNEKKYEKALVLSVSEIEHLIESAVKEVLPAAIQF